MASILTWLKSNWATISAVLLAALSAAWPAQTEAIKVVLNAIAVILGAGAVGHYTARLAVRSEAKRLGLVVKD
ncbi:hypothetical protein [Paludisphaera rhizosphaerae]|uniref:hypothetical protein n=1 Tax=Paludisphaera rhizosphaerae TaxID=2711216 RepID=UPI0013EC4AC5|nr:hypothetical protein [Paludisphaera rhizosphaerae]